MSVSASNGSARGLALVCPGSEAAAIGRACAAQGLGTEPYEDVEGLLQNSPGGRGVLLWAEDSEVAAAAPAIERLVGAGAAPVLVLCESLRPWDLRAVLQAGARGVILRSEIGTALAPCLAASAAGQVCIPRSQARRVEPPALSAREKQVLGLVVMGHTNGEIAGRLFLAESTVKSHLSSAFGKLGVRSRNEAVELILDPERGLGLGILGLSVEPVA
jgi:DNA-binding CsgD family transcriptional regulator